MSLLAGPVGASATSPGEEVASASVSASVSRGLPDDPTSYAAAAFRAWRRGDLSALSTLAEPQVVEILTAQAPEPGRWGRPQCEGAAGSTYCAWTRPEVQLVLRVRNDLASTGEPQAVIEAFFTTAPDRVAIWPLTTQEQADNTQVQVDQGHSPWHLDPATVASSYASAELGWEDAVVEQVQPGTFRVTDPESGASALITLAQPAREGEGGIWAVTRVGSA